MADNAPAKDKHAATATIYDRGFAALSGYAMFLAAIQAATIAASLAELNVSALLARSILVAAALAGGLVYRRLGRSRTELPELDAPGPVPRWKPATVVVFAAAITYAALWVLACTCPDMSCDGNTYHLPGIHLWAVKGYVHWIDPAFPEAKFMNGYPKGIELMSFVLARALGTHWVSTANLSFLPLGVLGVACLARRMGASRGMSLFAGAAMVLVPVNMSQADTTYVDSGFASCAVGYVAALIVVISRMGPPGAAVPWSALPALGACMGLTLAGKGTGALLVLVGLIVLAVRVVAKARAARGGFLAGGTMFGLSAVAIAMAVGGFWNIRNYAITGNPIYPVQVTVAGHTIFPGDDLSKMIGFEETAPAVFSHWPACAKAPYTWAQIGDWWPRTGDYRTCWPDTMWFLDSRFGGLGFLWLLGCVPAILAMLVLSFTRPPARGRWVFYCLLAVVGVTFVAWPMNWWARYTVWIYALGLPCFAAVATGILNRLTAAPRTKFERVRRFWLTACTVILVVEGLLALALNVAWARHPNMYGSIYLLPALFQESPRHLCPIMPELDGSVFDEILAGDDPVAIRLLEHTQQKKSGTYKILILGQLSQPIGRRPLVPVPDTVDADAVAALREKKVRYVILDDELPSPPALASAAVRICRAPGYVVFVLR